MTFYQNKFNMTLSQNNYKIIELYIALKIAFCYNYVINMNVQSRHCALSVRGWDVAPKRRKNSSAMQCRIRCHIQRLAFKHYPLFVVASLPFKEKGGAFFD